MSKKNIFKIILAVLSAIIFILLLVLFCLDMKEYIEYKEGLESLINIDPTLLNPMKRELAASFSILILPLITFFLSIFSISSSNIRDQTHQKMILKQKNNADYNLIEENIAFYENHIKQTEKQRNEENCVDLDKQLVFLKDQLEYWKSKKN